MALVVWCDVVRSSDALLYSPWCHRWIPHCHCDRYKYIIEILWQRHNTVARECSVPNESYEATDHNGQQQVLRAINTRRPLFLYMGREGICFLFFYSWFFFFLFFRVITADTQMSLGYAWVAAEITPPKINPKKGKKTRHTKRTKNVLRHRCLWR